MSVGRASPSFSCADVAFALEDCLCLKPPPGLGGNATGVAANALEHMCLQELLNTRLRLQSRWLEKPGDTFSVASTAATEVGEESPTSLNRNKGECLRLSEFLPPPSPASKSLSNLPQSILPLASPVEGFMREIRMENVDGHLWIHWPVDAKKLRGKDKQIISSTFEVCGASFKMMILPKSAGERKGQACFQKARGCGSIALKLLASANGAGSPTKLLFNIAIGSGEQKQAARGPVESDLDSSICGLPKCDEGWDFLSALDPGSSTVTISLQVLRAPAPETRVTSLQEH